MPYPVGLGGTHAQRVAGTACWARRERQLAGMTGLGAFPLFEGLLLTAARWDQEQSLGAD